MVHSPFSGHFSLLKTVNCNIIIIIIIIIIEEPEKAPDWLTTGVTYLIPKLGDSKDVRNNHVQNPNRNNSQKNFHPLGREEFTTSRTKRMPPWK
jgi:hypothetical protein